MTITDVKQIRISDYLHSLGYNPIKQQGGNLWYKSPFRQEKEPSFKVNTELNLWYDFGAGKGGNIIALAQELYASDDLYYLLERIVQQAPHVRPVSFSFGQQSPSQPSFQHLEICDLAHPALLRYLQGRSINIGLAKKECKELHFIYNGKPYFAIGFPNVSGGYEVRNSFFKGCIAPKDITHIRQQGEAKDKCLVFEGMMDYLSFLTLRMRNCPTIPNLDKQDYVILNSTVNVTKAIDALYPYKRIHCLLDNDYTGWKATREIKKKYSYRVRDFSHNYQGYADLNDYLCGKKQEQTSNLSQQEKQVQQSEQQEQEPTIKKSRGFRM
ncbi:toprim domain-containing protein [Bacteroides acidifaciens]|uniref:toprim domain-containing protein n=1 Tax=Bacteroides acidifaciens TaxID=85831 RepID=UPI003014C359